MKQKIIIITVVLTLIISCVPPIDEGPFVGIEINIFNLTENEIENAKLLIGGMENEAFISTESFALPTLIVRPDENYYQVVALDENRWKPNLNLINEISDKAYFAFQFEDGEQILLSRNGILQTFEIMENESVKANYGVSISISLKQDTVEISGFSDDNY